MNWTKPIVVVALVISACMSRALATDRFFTDITVQSPSKQYQVQAKSPDNARKQGHVAFQASFVYTLQDTKTGRVLWTRKQAMGKPQKLGDNSTRTYCLPEEGSPVDIFVSDGGWTVIRTGWDELIAVDRAGSEHCRIRLLSAAFSKEERNKYVSETTAGPMWSGYSLWYFLDTDAQHWFVVRPWWGHRVVMDLETGQLASETPRVAAAAATYERSYVLSELSQAVATRRQWEKGDRCESLRPVLTASYLAGRIPVSEATPLLEALQDSTYVGSSTTGGMSALEPFQGEVDPHSYRTFTLRQLVHLSLRRLGKAPRPLPLNEFDVRYKVYKKDHPYIPKTAAAPRAANAGKVKKGLRAEEVLDLLGGPDFVGYDTWEYDLDATTPFSLILKWDVRRVIDVQKKTPALWQEGLVRDRQVVE